MTAQHVAAGAAAWWIGSIALGLLIGWCINRLHPPRK